MMASHDDALSGCLEVCRRCRELVGAVTVADRDGSAYLRLGPHLRHCGADIAQVEELFALGLLLEIGAKLVDAVVGIEQGQESGEATPDFAQQAILASPDLGQRPG